nr:hypothetical protein [Gammaproteobacteria bacterium]
MKNIQVNVIDSASVVENHKVVDGKLLVIEAQKGCNYELFNAVTGTAPQNIIAKRVGQDLMIILDENEGEGSPDEVQPDVMIKGYYGEDRGEEGDTDATGILIGLHENGKYYAYIPESGEAQDAVSILADEMAEPQAIGGEELECGAFFFPWWGLLPLLAVPFLFKGSDDEPAPQPETVNNPPKLADDSKEGVVGRPVTVKVLDNDTDDKGIDPATVRLLDKNDNPVTELTVPNEGTWKVNPQTGDVTFTPDSGFTGNPAPVQYIAKDTDGEPAKTPAVIDVNYPQPPVVTPEQQGELELIKTSTEPTTVKVGDTIEYVFTVKNTGDVLVKNITVNDPKLGVTNLAIDKAELAPGETGTAKAEYTVTQADIDSGKVVNTATVTGKDPSGKDVIDISDNGTPTDDNGDGNPDNDPTVTDLPDSHKIELFKKSIISSKATVGDEITYVFTVKNTGNITVKDITITDTKLGANKVIKIGDLAPGDSKEVSAQYTITQADVNNGEVINSATAEGKDPQGHTVTDKSDSTNPTDINKPGDDDPTTTIIQRPPVAKNDSEDGELGKPVKVKVLDNDTDPDGNDTIDKTSVKLLDPNGKEVTELVVPNEGTWKVDPTTGDVTFTPKAGFTDDPTAIQYVVSDKDGNKSNPALIDVDYPPVVVPKVADKIIVSNAPTVREADDAYLVYDVKLSSPVGSDVVAKLSIDPTSTAKVNEDFKPGYEYEVSPGNWQPVPTNGEITLPKDGTAVKVRVAVKDDAITEPNETVVLVGTTTDPQVKDGKDSGVGIIEDDKPTTPVDNPNPVDEDIKANIVVDDAQTIVEGKEDYLIYTVKLDRAVNNDVLTKLSIAGDSADVVAGQDYVEQFEYLKNGQWIPVPTDGIKLPAEGSDVLVRVKVLDDAITENDEAIILTGTTTDAQIDKKSDTGKGIIKDDKPTTPTDNPNPVDEDIKANLIVEDAGTVKEGKDVYLEYDVKLDRAVNNDVLTKLSTSGTATAGEDYDEKLEYKSEDGTWKEVPVDGIELPAEGTAVKVRVKVLDDVFKEPSETVILKGETTDSQMTDTGRTDTGTGTITDEEKPFDPSNPDTPNEKDGVLVSIVDDVDTVNEGEKATFPIELKDQDGNPVEAKTPVTVELTYTGTAEDGKDYTSVKTIVIPKGQSTADLDIKTLVDDISGEPLENVKITIDKVSGGGFEDIIPDPAKKTADLNIKDITDAPKAKISTVVADGVEPVDANSDGTNVEFKVEFEDGVKLPTDATITLKPTANSEVVKEDIAKILYTPKNADGTDGQQVELSVDDFFNGTGVPVTIAQGQTEAGKIEFVPAHDDIYEISEKLEVQITKPASDTTAFETDKNADTAEGVIKDENDPNKPGENDGDKPSLTVGNSEVSEGEELVFDITLSNPVSKPTTLTLTPNFTGTDNTAEPEDIAAITVTYTDKDGAEQTLAANPDGTYTIPAGVTNLQAKTPAVDDDIYEKSEKFTLTGKVALPDNSTISDDGIGTIKDEDGTTPTGQPDPEGGDKPTVQINVAPEEVTEGDGKSLVFTVDYQDPNTSESDSVVHVQQSAVAGVENISADDITSIVYTDKDGKPQVLTTQAQIKDFLENGVDVKIPAGDKVAPAITITPKNDDVYEVSEKLQLGISEPATATADEKAYTIGTPNATGTVYDDAKPTDPDPKDPTGDKPALSITAIDPKAVEGTADDTIKFEVTQDKQSNFETKVTVTLENLDIEDKDIKTIMFDKGDGSTPVAVSVADLKAGYEISIPAKADVKTVKPSFIITPEDDTEYEGNEDFKLKLSNPDKATIVKAEDTATIEDNDAAPVVGITAPTDTAAETDDGSQALVYDVSIENGTTLPTDSVVHVKPNNADNVSPVDVAKIVYTDANGVETALDTPEKIQKFFDEGMDVTIPAGKTTAGTIKVVPAQDNIYEVEETLQLDLTKPATNTTALTVGEHKNAIGTITDEDGTTPTGDPDPKGGDKPAVSIEATTNEATEGKADSKLVFEISQDKPSNKDTTVTAKLVLEENTAGKASAEDIESITLVYFDKDGNKQTEDLTVDQAIAGKDVTIFNHQDLANQKKPYFEIVPKDDYLDDNNETLNMTISDPVNAKLGTPEDTGTINDEPGTTPGGDPDPNPKDSVYVSIVDNVTEVPEGSNGKFTVQLTDKDGNLVKAVTDVTVELNYDKADGTTNPAQADDFTGPQSVTIKAGSSSADFEVTATPDTIAGEPNEVVDIKIENPQGGGFENIEVDSGDIDNNTHTDKADMTIVDVVTTKPTIGITIPTPTAVEGETTGLVYDVSLDNGQTLAKDAVMNVKPNNADSVSPADIASITYTDAKGNETPITDIEGFFKNGIPVTVKAGDTTAGTITIVPKQDDIYEISETLQLDLTKAGSNKADVAISKPSAIGTIEDENDPDKPGEKDGDKPKVSIVADPDTATEGVADSKLVFTVSQDKDSNFETTVKAKLVLDEVELDDIASIVYDDGTGAPAKTLTPYEVQKLINEGWDVKIPAHTTDATKMPKFTIVPEDDATYEVSEKLHMDLVDGSAENASIDENKKTDEGTILDEGTNNQGDLPQVNIAVSPEQVTEGDGQTLAYTVSYGQTDGKQQLSNNDSIVHVKPSDMANVDNITAEDIQRLQYTKADGTKVDTTDDTEIKAFFTNGADVKIVAGDSSAPAIIFTPINDNIYEISEKLELTITNP